MRVSGGLWVYGLAGKMRIQTFPRLFISRTMVRRAASICRAVTQPGSSACSPYSPKLTSAPRKALPLIRPRICLRHFTRFGINIVTTSSEDNSDTRLFAHVYAFSRLRLFFSFWYGLALVNPDFYAKLTVGCAGFRLGEIKIRAQGLERNTSITQRHVA